MRQGQQNRRGRGRNNNNHSNNGPRKGQNPLARSYESSGPDVKLRGTPAHIAEKYMALARDAQSSGDPVLAENYLQHAEHYNRIILAYREQQIAQGGGDPGMGGMPRQRPPFGSDPGEHGSDFSDDDGDDLGASGAAGSSLPPTGLGEQPPAMTQPRFEGGQQRLEPRQARHDHQPRGEHRYPPRDRHSGEQRGGYQERGERPERQERERGFERHSDRPERGERPERPDRDRGMDRPERSERAPQSTEAGAGDGAPRRRERFQPPNLQHEQPEFLRRPVRRPRREDSGEVAAPQPAPAAASDDQE